MLNNPRRYTTTERDIQMLNFINEFGFCDVSYIKKRFRLKERRAYQLMNRLIEMELIYHKPILDHKPGFYHVTSKGATYTSLPAIADIPIGLYEHQLAIIDVYLTLMARYPHAEWVSERQLEYDKHSDGKVGKRGHIPDGILILPNQKQVAIEVELKQKGKNRLATIWKGYASQFDTEVWYYCATSLVKSYQKSAAKFSYIKVLDLQEFLA